MKQRIAVRSARLHQQHLVARILREPVGQHAAGGPRSENDVIEHGATLWQQ